MMQPNSDFVGRECSVLSPILDVTQAGKKHFPNLVGEYAETFLGSSVFPRPFPNTSQHFPMEFSYIRVRPRRGRGEPSFGERPSIRFKNVQAFKLIQLPFRGDAWDQRRQFVGVEFGAFRS